jgi:hypothetical protein
MTEALKACPVIKGIGLSQPRGGFAALYIDGTTYTAEQVGEAIAAWNQRATPSATAMQQALEALRECADVIGSIPAPYNHRIWVNMCSAISKARAAIPALEAAMQPSEEEVERVARAICDDLTGTQGVYPIGEDDRRTARAVIAAMGEG